MRSGTILHVSFIIGVIGILVGATLKIMHWSYAETWLIAGVITWAVFIITAIYEVSSSGNISRTEKTMWIVGFLLMAGLTALIYLLVGRRSVVGNGSPNKVQNV
jgi:hypothetical protein